MFYFLLTIIKSATTFSLGRNSLIMVILRKLYEQLKAWKESSNQSKAILIKGARRVGKSYLSLKFAKNEYKSYILIDFSSLLPGTLQIFKKYGNKYLLDEFFNQLSILYSTPLYTRQSVFIFDEVQRYPKARELIKHLVADGRYDYIETGSLISIKKNTKDIIIPSEEEEILMYPLDFEEFLTAIGDCVTYETLKQAFNSKRPLGNMLKSINEKLRLYMIIGGMPQAVLKYIETKNYDDVEKIKRNIIKLYREDIVKYADNYAAEAAAVFNAIPSSLSHHDKKIKYSTLHEGDRFSCYKDALNWINDSMVGILCYGLDEPTIFDGFSLQTNKVKCYMADTGLLLTLAAGDNYLKSNLYKSFVLGKTSVNKGMMTENLIAQIITANGRPLRFYETIDKTNSNATKDLKKEKLNKKYEVDFLIKVDDKTTAIEVNSGNAKLHSSLDYFVNKYRTKTNKPIILTKGDLSEIDDYLYLPLAMACFL